MLRLGVKLGGRVLLEDEQKECIASISVVEIKRAKAILGIEAPQFNVVRQELKRNESYESLEM